MNWKRYLCPAVSPRALRFHRASVKYCSEDAPAGNVSLPGPSVVLPCAGSASTVMVDPLADAPFQVPKTSFGATGEPLNCQSPDRLVESPVMSVMNSDGKY